MKKAILMSLLACVLVLGCQMGGMDASDQAGSQKRTLKVADENDPIVVPATGADNFPTPSTRWSCPTHVSVASIAALQWGLSSARAGVIADASDYPDTYQSGLDNGYKQQWTHAYIYDDWFGSVFYLWGGADTDFHDNIDGPSGGDGYNGSYAGAYYNAGSQYGGDQYLGYAIHYIEDVSLTLHSTAPDSAGVTVPYYTLDMITNHFNFESWVENNLTAGYRLLDAVSADYNYYAVTDLKQAVKNAALASCSYKGTSSIGYTAWKEYRNCGYPTAAGTGSAALVDNTKKMLIAAGRYAKGAIKYALDKYGQWTSQY
jgi:hypothetical protein